MQSIWVFVIFGVSCFRQGGKNLEGKWSQRTQTVPHSGGQDMVAELSQEAAFLCRAEALVVKDGWHVKTKGGLESRGKLVGFHNFQELKDLLRLGGTHHLSWFSSVSCFLLKNANSWFL